MEIIKTTKDEIKGSKILAKNSFFVDLIKIMKNDEFKKFYDNYFHDWTDIQTMVFYMKMHNTVAFEYNRRTNTIISDELMTYTLYNIMNNNETRKHAMKLFQDYKEISHDKSYDFRTLIQFDTSLTIKDKF